MKFIHLYIKLVNSLNEFLGRTVAWLTTFLVLVVCFDVLRRYFFKSTSVAIIELEWYIFSLVFLLGAGYALKHDQHVRVDVFYNRMSEKNKAWINLLGTIFFLIPFCIVSLYASYKFTAYSFQLNEFSPNPGGLPATYLIKAAIPIGFIFLLLQGTVLLLSSFLVIIGQKLTVFENLKGEHSNA